MRRWVGDIDQRGDFAIDLGRHGRHLVPQPEVERQVRSPAPVVLHIGTVEGLASVPRSCNSKGCIELRGMVGEEFRQGTESEFTTSNAEARLFMCVPFPRRECRGRADPARRPRAWVTNLLARPRLLLDQCAAGLARSGNPPDTGIASDKGRRSG